MLLLGVVQAQKGEVVPPAPTGSFDLLETQVLTANAASVTFASLGTYAADYQHLQLRMTTQEVGSSTLLTQTYLRLNSDTGNNYAWHTLNGNGSSVTSSATTSTSQIQLSDTVPRSSQTGVWGAIVVDILDAFSTNKNSTLRALHGGLASGETDINLTSGLWNNTDALTTVTLVTANGINWSTGSRFSLYGVRTS